MASISDAAVKSATGKSWNQWFAILDRWSAEQRTHQEVATRLEDRFGLSGWWSQEVTVHYERARGLRQVGETKDSSYQIGVQKTFQLSVPEAWSFLLSAKGRRLWLGNIPKRVIAKGKNYKTEDGTTGEFRVIVPENRLRLTWKPSDWSSPSILQLRLVPGASGRTSIRFHQEKIPDHDMRSSMRAHWNEVLEALFKIAPRSI